MKYNKCPSCGKATKNKNLCDECQEAKEHVDFIERFDNCYSYEPGDRF